MNQQQNMMNPKTESKDETPFLKRKYQLSYWVLGLVVLLLAGVGVFWMITSGAKSPASSTIAVPENYATSRAIGGSIESQVGMVEVQSRDFTSKFSAVGIIEIAEPSEHTISARASGRIDKLYVSSTGSVVRKGEPLYEFYSPDILNAESEFLIAAKTKLQSMEQPISDMPDHEGMLSNGGLISASKKRLELLGMTAEQIEKLQANGQITTNITVRAPAGGVVMQKLSQEGAYVEEGATLFQLADLSTVWAEVDVPETNIQFIKIGQPIHIHTEAYSNAEFTGKVIFISPVEDQASRTIRVRIALNNPAYKLRPQMTFTADIPIESGRALAVPASAVVRTGDGDYVWVKDNGDAFMNHKVTLGVLSPDNYYAVLDGLKEGDLVASTGAFMLDAERQLSENNPMATMKMNTSNQGSRTSGEGTATVRSIDAAKQMITLDHGSIPGVMPAMTMGYKVSSPKMLNVVQINDKVRFTLSKNDNGEYQITSITKQQ